MNQNFKTVSRTTEMQLQSVYEENQDFGLVILIQDNNPY